MVDWRTLEAKVDRTIGATFGESVRLSFLAKGAVDPARPQLTISAVLHVAGDAPAAMGGKSDTKFSTHLAAGAAEMVIDRSTYEGPKVEQGDKVQALDRVGKPWFEVAFVSDRHTNLIILSMTEA